MRIVIPLLILAAMIYGVYTLANQSPLGTDLDYQVGGETSISKKNTIGLTYYRDEKDNFRILFVSYEDRKYGGFVNTLEEDDKGNYTFKTKKTKFPISTEDAFTVIIQDGYDFRTVDVTKEKIKPFLDKVKAGTCNDADIKHTWEFLVKYKRTTGE